jgi:DNA helicase HerA-like ATPase
VSAADLAAELLEPLAAGRGVRVVAVGVTGSGKSYALRELVARAAPSLDVVFAVDDSEDAGGWDGQRRIDLPDCTARPLVARDQGGSNVVVLEGNALERRLVDCEAVAGEGWRLVARGYRVAVAFDELRRACKSAQHWNVEQGEVARLFTEGRKYGLSAFAATNFPQELPREAIGQSTLLVFALDGKERVYLERTGLVSSDLARVIERLGDRQFVVRRVGALTDTRVFRF